jgi:hypothetical protein
MTPEREDILDLRRSRMGGGYARGGIVPERVVGWGTQSGQRYEFGEDGPEGVVPNDMLPAFLKQRHGIAGRYMVGGQIGYDPEYDPYSTPLADPTLINQKAPGGGFQYPTYTDTSGGQVDNPYGSVAPITEAPVPTPTPTPTPSPLSSPTLSPQQQQDLQQYLDWFNAQQTAPAPAPAGSPGDTSGGPPAGQPDLQPVFPQQPTGGGTGGVSPLIGGNETPFPTPTPQFGGGGGPAVPVAAQPIALPQNGQVSTPAPFGTPTPRDLAPAGTFGGTVSTRPYFQPGEDTPFSALSAAGAIPPFLSRVMAQGRGEQAFGTNQPQRFNLPADVPLVSRLSYLQMSPSERAAFSSYISSYGIDPSDYFDYMESASPQGGQHPLPTFGTRFNFNPSQS